VINSISSAFSRVPCEGVFDGSLKRPGFSEFLFKRPLKNSRKQGLFAMRPRCKDRPVATRESAANWVLPNVAYPQANVRAYWPEGFRIGMELSPFAFTAAVSSAERPAVSFVEPSLRYRFRPIASDLQRDEPCCRTRADPYQANANLCNSQVTPRLHTTRDKSRFPRTKLPNWYRCR
jgi:hypothetical protein